MADGSNLPEQLRALGNHLDVQPADDLVDRVLAGVGTRRAGMVPWQVVVVLVMALLLLIGGVVVVSPPVRAAIVRVFGGVEVKRTGAPTPAVSPALPGEHRTDLATAGRQVGFRVRIPAALGSPDEVTVADGRVVSLVYHLPTGLVRIDEFAGNLGVMWDKYAAGLAEPVTVNEHPGLWFSAPVILEYVDRYGVAHPESARQTGSTLVWIDGDLTFRLDGVASMAAAIALAASVR